MPARWQFEHGVRLSHLTFLCLQMVQLRNLDVELEAGAENPAGTGVACFSDVNAEAVSNAITPGSCDILNAVQWAHVVMPVYALGCQ